MISGQQHRWSTVHTSPGRHIMHRILGYVVAMAIVIVALLINVVSSPQAYAAVKCNSGEKSYRVVAGDTLSIIGQRHDTSWQQLAERNQLNNPNVISVNQQLCVPGKETSTTKPDTSVARGAYNSYPYGQCTWWADDRYHQLHGIYVPWLYNSDAWRWADRAREHGWKVSSKPKVGSILVMQKYVQGTGGYGHVAIVEKVLPGGRVLTSNMNWGRGATVVNVTFKTGPGISFVSHK